jgi:hypothetical protein
MAAMLCGLFIPATAVPTGTAESGMHCSAARH